MKNDEDNNAENESFNIIDIVAQEAERVVAESCEAAKLEAEQELENALREYEQRTRQIVLKIKEGAKSRTAEIADRLGEAIMVRIENSSTEAVAEVIAEFGEKAEHIIRTIQETSVRESEEAPVGVENEAESDTESDDNNSTVFRYATRDEAIPAAGSQQEAEVKNDSKKPSFGVEVENELAGITEDKANGKSKLDSEDFEHWLAQ